MNVICLYFFSLFHGLTPVTSPINHELPISIKATFEQLFPLAKAVEWEEDEMEYYLYFENGKHNVEAFISKTGQWIQTNTFIEYEELPVRARTFIEEHYKEDIPYFDGVLQLDTPEASYYVVTFESEGAGINLLFTDTGNLLSE